MTPNKECSYLPPMHTPIPPLTPPDDEAYYRAVVYDLVNRGADLARLVHERAAEQPEIGHTIAFDRIARTIRRINARPHHRLQPTQAPRRTHASSLDDHSRRGRRDRGQAAPPAETGIIHQELHRRLDDAAVERDLRSDPARHGTSHS